MARRLPPVRVGDPSRRDAPNNARCGCALGAAGAPSNGPCPSVLRSRLPWSPLPRGRGRRSSLDSGTRAAPARNGTATARLRQHRVPPAAGRSPRTWAGGTLRASLRSARAPALLGGRLRPRSRAGAVARGWCRHCGSPGVSRPAASVRPGPLGSWPASRSPARPTLLAPGARWVLPEGPHRCRSRAARRRLPESGFAAPGEPPRGRHLRPVASLSPLGSTAIGRCPVTPRHTQTAPKGPLREEHHA